MSKYSTDKKTTNEMSDKDILMYLHEKAFYFFLEQVNEENGLVIDKSQEGTPSSIAVVGLALASYISGVERGLMTREDAVKRTLTTMRFFYNSEQSESPEATGYKGFYYHFLDMKTGKRVWESELSSIDTALLIAGMITAHCYYTNDTDDEKEIRFLADELYRRVDWAWMLNDGLTLSHGWLPESGFLSYHWSQGYNEAMILYILALGSPTYPIGIDGYREWLSTFEWKERYGIEHLYAGPLFIHHFTHMWIDFRGIMDDFNRKVGIDYFENSRRATLIQQQYAIENPNNFKMYGKYAWGLTASDGPGPCTRTVDGRKVVFYNYISRGVDGPDDGTISPWAVAASLPFAPDIVLDTMRHIAEKLDLLHNEEHGLHAGFNPTFPDKKPGANGWVSPWHYGLNQGPVVIMIENYMTGLFWKILRECPYISKGLSAAGFTGGWLDKQKRTTANEND